MTDIETLGAMGYAHGECYVELCQCREALDSALAEMTSLQESCARLRDRCRSAESQLSTTVSSERARWQPIESAPKDGTEFDAWCPVRKRIPFAYWSDGRFYFDADNASWPFDPTHWMPLPEPPIARAIEQQEQGGET